MPLGAHWVFSIQSALPTEGALSCHRGWRGGKAKGAVTETRHLGVVHPTFLSELCR